MKTRPISDLRNHYSDVEREAESDGPVFLTKKGRLSVDVMSFEQRKGANELVEQALDTADRLAASVLVRYSHDEVFGSIREMLHSPEPQAQ